MVRVSNIVARASAQSNPFLFRKVHPKPLNMHSFVVIKCHKQPSINRWTEYGGVSIAGEMHRCFEVTKRLLQALTSLQEAVGELLEAGDP